MTGTASDHQLDLLHSGGKPNARRPGCVAAEGRLPAASALRPGWGFTWATRVTSQGPALRCPRWISEWVAAT